MNAPFPLAVTGPYGLVGRGLFAARPGVIPLARRPAPDNLGGAVPAGVPPADVTDEASLSKAVEWAAKTATGPLVLLHLAALTDTRSADRDAMERVNVGGARNAMKAARNVGGLFVHVSTDYVFAADPPGDGPRLESERPSVEPKDAYSASKFRAENLVLDEGDPGRTFVVRIALPYGDPSGRGLDTKIADRLQAAGPPPVFFSDQKISPSYLSDIHAGLVRLSVKAARSETRAEDRVLHVVGPVTTPYEFALLARNAFGLGRFPLKSGSVAGTPYAANLWLANEQSSRFLELRSTPPAEGLRAAARLRAK